MSVEVTVQSEIATPAQKAAAVLACEPINALEAALVGLPQRECPVTHRFTPGLYTREIFMPACADGTIVTSKIHKTEHPFAILSGRVSVWQADTGWVHHVAPFIGITKPFTRRVLFVHEDTRWATFHVTNETDLAKIEAELILPHGINEQADITEALATLK